LNRNWPSSQRKCNTEEINELEEILREQEEEVVEGKTLSKRIPNSSSPGQDGKKQGFWNGLLLGLLDLLSKTLKNTFKPRSGNQKSLQGHREVLVALRNGNGAAARQAMRSALGEMWRVYSSKKRKEVFRIIGFKGRDLIPDIDFLTSCISLIDQPSF